MRPSPPILGHFTHTFYQLFTIAKLKQFSSVSMKQWYDTTRYLNFLLPTAENREKWLLLNPKLQ
jgi:hypothetical protein